MADVCSTVYQPVLNTVEGFLIKTNELTKENKGRLRKFGEISEVVASIGKEKGEDKGTPTVRVRIKNVCSALLFGSYTELLSRLSDIVSTVHEMENKQREDESFKLPKAMQAGVDAVKHYLKRAQGQLEEIDNTISDLTQKVKEARRKNFKISDEEIADLEMDAVDVNRTLDSCKKYLDEAGNEINLLESHIASEMKSFAMKTAAMTSGFGTLLMIGGALLAPSEILKLTVKELTVKLGYVRDGLLIGGTMAGAMCLALSLAVIIDDHKQLFTPHLEALETELREVKTKYEVRKD